MIDVKDIPGWKPGGGIAGRSTTVLGTNKETEVVCYLSVSGPTEYNDTTYTVAVGKHSDRTEYRKRIKQGIQDETGAKILAAEFMKNHPFVDIDLMGPVQLRDKNGETINV